MLLRILITELGTIQGIEVSESLSQLLMREEFGLKSIKNSDLRIRNLEFADDMYEMSLEPYRLLASLADHYQKMDKAMDYYARKYSPALVKGVVGDVDNLLATSDFGDLAKLPAQVIGELRHYFNEPFIIEDVRLSDEKHANVKFVDDTAEFRILFTILDVAMPDDMGVYHREPLMVDVFGKYDNQIYFDFVHAKTDKSKFLGYDERMYEKRHDYLQMIFDACQDRDGKPLRQVLEAVAQTFVYDFWLE